jgi:hypothetical protein
VARPWTAAPTTLPATQASRLSIRRHLRTQGRWTRARWTRVAWMAARTRGNASCIQAARTRATQEPCATNMVSSGTSCTTAPLHPPRRPKKCASRSTPTKGWTSGAALVPGVACSNGKVRHPPPRLIARPIVDRGTFNARAVSRTLCRAACSSTTRARVARSTRLGRPHRPPSASTPVTRRGDALCDGEPLHLGRPRHDGNDHLGVGTVQAEPVPDRARRGSSESALSFSFAPLVASCSLAG